MSKSAFVRQRGWRVAAIGAMALLVLAFWLRPTQPTAQTASTSEAMPVVPSVKIVKGTLISPAAADSWYNAQTQSVTDGLCRDYGTNAQICPGGVRPRAPEIRELARALRNDPNLIYEYVRNSIDTEFLFGSHKGALGVIIDHSGTAFDQAELMVELLRESGFTARYKYGAVTLTGTQFQQWTGLTNAKAACDFLATGGIPATVSSCAANATVSSVTMSHVWVEADIGGSARFFDPAFKPYEHKAGIDVRSAMGFASGQVASAAGGSESTTSTAGVSVAPGVSQSGLSDKLGVYSQALLARLQQSDMQGASMTDVVGGRIIEPAVRPAGGWLQATPSGYAASATWSTNVPDPWRAKVNLYAEIPASGSVPASVLVSANFFADEIYGRKTELASMPNGEGATAATWLPGLKFDGVSLAIGAPMSDPYRLGIFLKIKADHPFAAPVGGVNGTYGDATASKPFNVFHPATLVIAWGSTSPALGAKWESEQNFDTEGYITVSAPLAEDPPAISPSGDLLRARIAATWLGQFSLAADIHSELANARPVLLHTIGVVSADQQAVAIPQQPHNPGDVIAGDVTGFVTYDEVAVVDLESSFGLVSRVSDNNARKAAIQALAATGAALEGSVVAQLTDTPDAESTAARLAWGNNPELGETPNTSTRPVYRFANGTAATNAFDLTVYDGGTGAVAAYNKVPAIDQGMVDYMRGQLSKTVKAYADAGFDVVASSESSLGPGHRIGSEVLDSIVQVAHYSRATSLNSASTCMQAARAWASSFVTDTSTARDYADDVSLYYNTSCSLAEQVENMSGAELVDGMLRRYITVNTYRRLPSLQRGGAIIATRYDTVDTDEPLEIANVLTRYGPPTKGGGGPSVSQVATYNPSEAAQSLRDRFVDRSSVQGVDLGSGRAGFVSPVLASVGQGQFPYRLERRVDLRGGVIKSLPAYVDELGGALGRTGDGAVSNWRVTADIANSGYESMGQSRVEAAVPTIVAYVAMQDVWGSMAKGARRELTGALTAKWWADRLLFNVVTVLQGGSAQQFARLTNGAFVPTNGGGAKLTMTGDRELVRPDYEKQFRSAGAHQEDNISRGWKYNSVGFILTGANGDKQTFQYWSGDVYAPPANPLIPAKHVDSDRGWRMTSWTFPQGVTLTIDYATRPGAGATTLPTDTPTRVNSNLGYGLDIPAGDASTDGAGGLILTDLAGSKTKVLFRAPMTRSPTQRPDPEYRPLEIYAPDNLTLPAVRYAYDSLGRVKEARDAVAVQQGTRGPHQFFIAEGYRGERQDPQAAKATRLDKPGVASPGLYTVETLRGGRLIRTTDEDGRVVTTSLDGRGRVLSRTLPEGDKVLFEYDGLDNVTKLTKCPKPGCNPADNLVVTATYDPVWNKLATITDPMGRTTNFEYYGPNTNGASLMSVAARPSPNGAPGQPTYGFEYDAFGQLIRMTDPDWVETVSTYDVNHFLNSTRTGPASLNLITTFQNNALGDVVDTWDVRGQSVSGVHTDYDLMRRPTQVTAPLGAVTKTTYDAVGRPTKVEKRLWDGTTETWQTVRTGYTPTGQTAWLSDPSSDVTTFEYDELDRKVKSTGPAGDISAWTYDLAGQPIREKRAVGIAASPGEQDYVTWSYTPNGQKASVSDARGNTSTFVYDGFDRLLRTVFPDLTWEGSATNTGTTDAAMYNKAGDQLRYRTREGHFVLKTYDNLSRPISLNATTSDGTTLAIGLESWRLHSATNVYSQAGRLKEANTDELLQSWVYDAAGRPIDHYDGSVASGRHFGYGYDPTLGRTTLTYPGGSLVATFTSDGLNRLTNVSTSGLAVTSASIAYDTLSRRTLLTFGDGSTQVYAYEPDDDISSISHVFPNRTTDNASFTWTYDKAGRQITETVSNTAYVLSPASLAQVYGAANGLNQYPTVDSATYAYDAAGMMISDGVRIFLYDEAGHQTRTSLTSDATTYSYDRYDALGQRFFHYRAIPAAADSSRLELTDGLRPEVVWEEVYSTAEGSSAATTTNQRYYVLGPNPDEHLIYIDKPSGAAVVRYPHTTKRGDVIAVAKAGLAEAKFKYGPFGESTDAPGTVYHFRFTGQRLDDWTGLYHFKARVYSPTLGRFLQPDPLGYGVGPNLYTYCNNDPYNCTDPDGRQDRDDRPFGNMRGFDWFNFGLREEFGTPDNMGRIWAQSYFGAYALVLSSLIFPEGEIAEVALTARVMAGLETGNFGTRAFWSGIGGWEKAMELAKARGATTLEMALKSTADGRRLMAELNKMPFEQSKRIWGLLSQSWAKGTRGEAIVLRADKLRAGNFWERFEKPILDRLRIPYRIEVSPR